MQHTTLAKSKNTKAFIGWHLANIIAIVTLVVATLQMINVNQIESSALILSVAFSVPVIIYVVAAVVSIVFWLRHKDGTLGLIISLALICCLVPVYLTPVM